MWGQGLRAYISRVLVRVSILLNKTRHVTLLILWVTRMQGARRAKSTWVWNQKYPSQLEIR
jgi:hypothetical protein